MKNVSKGLCILLIIVVSGILISVYRTHKIRYLNYYDRPEELAAVSYMSFYEDRNETRIYSKQTIKEVMDYLNSIPFTDTLKDNSCPENIAESVSISFCVDGIEEAGWLSFYSARGKEYVLRSLDLKLFKARDEDVSIISGLRRLILSSQ